MIKRLKPKSEFSRNVLTLMTGTTIAQAIPIAITPILTRIYTPEEFGLLALFVAITVILGTIANARYELAITLPEQEEDAIEVASLGVVIASFFSVLLLVPFVFLNEQITNLLDNTQISFWLYCVPLVVWFIGLFNVLSFLNTRYKNYQHIAKAHIYKSVALVGVQLILGLFKAGSAGLILGQIAASLSSVYRLANPINKQQLIKAMRNTQCLWLKAKRYRRFFIYMLPASLMNALSSNMLSLAIPVLFSMKTLGMYSLAQRALGAPSAIIGSSISQVYLQQASEEKNKTGKVVTAFRETLKKLVLLALVFFLPLYFVVEDLFALLFGESWREAGVYAQILIPYFAVNFIVSALSVTDSVMEKQFYYAAFNFIMLASVSVFLFFLSFDDFIYFISFLSMLLIILYLLYLILSWLVADARI